MPLIDDPSVGQSLLTPRGYFPLPGSDEETHPAVPVQSADPPAPGLLDRVLSIDPAQWFFGRNAPVLEAALRTDNTLGSAIAKFQDTHGVSNELVDPSYSPWTDVVGTPYEKYWRSTFAQSNNHAYTEALKRSIDRQEADRRTVNAGGWAGTVAGIGAGAIDPTMLLPVGGEVKLAGKGVWSIARGAVAGARAGAVGTTAYELGLHATQDIRTKEESALNIATGVILGATIGSTLAGALSRTQRVASEAALERLPQLSLRPGDAGAAALHTFSLDDLTINGKITENIAAGTAFSPNLRGNFRESPLARQTYQELATNVLRQQMHMAGETLGPSVETNIGVSLGETLGQALEAYPKIYTEMKKAGQSMPSDIFDQQVGQALRRADVGSNEYVTKAAKLWRERVINPLSKQAIDLGMLPEDISVKEAPSYFSRLYNVDKIVARRPEFMGITTDFYHNILQNNFAKESGELRGKLAELEQEAELAGMKPAAREKVLKSLNEGDILREHFAGIGDLGAHVTNVRQLQQELRRAFFDKWEIRRLGENVNLDDPKAVPDFSAHAKDMAQEVYDSITGNDYGSASIDPSFNLSTKSGPLKDRTFHIPDVTIEPFLEDNAVRVMSRFSRTMAAQIELERKFPGDGLLKQRFKDIKNEYDVLMEHAQTEAERTKLQSDMKGTFRDLRAFLEIHRGSYKAKENASSWGRVVRGLLNFNFIRSMGGAAIPSLSDLYNPAIFHPLQTMEVGVPALVKAVSRQGSLVREAKYAGVAERLAHHRLLTMTEIGDPYAYGTAIERALDAGTHFAAKWNGLTVLTDFEKSMNGIIVQHRINTALLENKAKEIPFLAESGIGAEMRTRITKFLQEHGTEEDGITVANTDQWNDANAVRAYRSAINFNVNANIVTRGIGDVPLAAYTPLGKLFLQFKTFNLAAHQRTMLRAMQLGPAQFLSGLIGLTTLGMFATTLRAWRGGEENWKRFQNSARNPGYMIGEGLDATGFFTLPIEIGNDVEKASAPSGYAFNPVKTPLMLAGRAFVPDSSLQGNTQRFMGHGNLGEVLAGPTGGLFEDVPIAVGGGIDKARGEDVAQSKINAANRIIPFGSYLGMREFLQVLEHNSPYVENQQQ